MAYENRTPVALGLRLRGPDALEGRAVRRILEKILPATNIRDRRLPPHLRRDVGLPAEPCQREWWEY